MTDRDGLFADARLVREEIHDGAMAMALDEVAARTAAEEGTATVRVYQWLPSTLSLGYRQDAETLDWDHIEEYGVGVVRRPTGGGGIYHDTHGDISYSIIAPDDEVPGDLMETYELFCEPLFDTFEELGVDARFADEPAEAVHEPACYLRALDPAHDIVAGEGRKLSGNAQYRQRDAVVQHGSISYTVQADQHVACFDSDLSPEAFRERVTALDEQATDTRENPDYSTDEIGPMDSFDFAREHAVRQLEEHLAAWAGAPTDPYGTAGDRVWTDAEWEQAQELAEEKYRSDEWTYERTDPTDD
ncbi:lipoate--protein ligase family protein [Halorarius halobius]|uniref:lipoate--protein ligase family protein n=1 Tax=Halorarius halobius TaxID=2962671 RepID=UPI0020CC375E|nr:biotin/lipoate A/B protein ligase family protein [Halorarius halobius]